MSHEPPDVFRRMLDLWNGGDVDPSAVYAIVPHDLAATVARYRAAFQDLRWTIDSWFAAGDRYVLRMHAVGTHAGEAFRFEGIEVHAVLDDLIVESDQVWDLGALYAVVSVPAAD